MTIHKKHDRLLRQKSRFFIAIKGVCLSADIVPSRKALKGLSQNIYQMLDLLYHKQNPVITTVVDGSIFRRGTYLYMSLFQFVHPSVCLSIRPSVVHHISGTVHHLIIILGTHM